MEGAMATGPDEAEKQTTQPMFEVERCEVDVHGMRMTMAKTQKPHDALHSMTLLYQWHIMDIKIDRYGYIVGPRESEVFALTGYDCDAKAILNRGLRIDLQLIDSKQTKIPIVTKSMPLIALAIESQSYTSQTTQDQQQLTQQHRDAIRTDFISFNKSLVYGEDIYGTSSWRIPRFTHPPYVASGQMNIKVYAEPPSIARNYFSNNGILLWRLDNYKERLQTERDGLIWCQLGPYFYTGPHGYRVLMRLRLSERSVWGELWFLKGEHDSSLSYEFPHRLTVTLFNQKDQSKDLVRSEERKVAEYTSFCFNTANASSLESDGYVANDSLLVKAVVEAL